MRFTLRHRQLLAMLLACCAWPTFAAELDARLKWLGSAALLPTHDVQRQSAGTPAFDMTGDLRVMFRHNRGDLGLIADYSVTVISGDSFAFANAPQAAIDQAPVDDDVRLMDHTAGIEDGRRHRSLHRLDRLALKFRRGDWSVTLGRDAVSWGNGLAFSPMDLFNPFAPTVVDQDHKAGDDLLLVERLFDNGSDLQLLMVGRRDRGDITGEAASVAAKWHSLIGESELEILAAKHYQDQVFALSVGVPVGGALIRSDLVATRLQSGTTRLSGVVNVAYSLLFGDTLVYIFGEYYRNRFGATRMPISTTALPAPLQTRLARGETFNVMRNYAATGVSVPWHPIVSQSFTLLLNLDDSSSLVQTSLTWEPADSSRLQAGLIKPLGRAGDEFGGVPLSGPALTAGGGTRVFVRWVHYF